MKDISDELDRVLADVQFMSPVTPEDCAAVRDVLREVFPSATIEVYCHTQKQVAVQVDRCRKYFAVLTSA